MTATTTTSGPLSQQPLLDPGVSGHWPSKPPRESLPAGSKRKTTDVDVLLKSFRLDSVANLFKKPQKTEGKKVAIYQSRLKALYFTLVYWIPIAVSIALLVLNGKGIIIAQNLDVVQNNAFQYAAKVYEMLMQASLGAAILNIVRLLALGDEGFLPLGLLMAPYNFSDVTYLWSPELFGGFLAKTRSLWRRWVLVCAVGCLVILANAVGPSGAVLMIPRPVDVSAGRFLAFMLPSRAMFPNNVGVDQENIFQDPSFNQSIVGINFVDQSIGYFKPDFESTPYFTARVQLKDFTATRQPPNEWIIAHTCREAYWGSLHPFVHVATVPNALTASVVQSTATLTGWINDGTGSFDPTRAIAQAWAPQPFVRISWHVDKVLSNGISAGGLDYVTFKQLSAGEQRDEQQEPRILLADLLKDNDTFPSGGRTFAFESSKHSSLVVWVHPLSQTDTNKPEWSVVSGLVDAAWVGASINSSADSCPGNPSQSLQQLSEDSDAISDGPLIALAHLWSERSLRTAMELQNEDLRDYYGAQSRPFDVSLSSIAAAYALGLSNIAYPFLGTGPAITQPAVGGQAGSSYSEGDWNVVYMESARRKLENTTANIDWDDTGLRGLLDYITNNATINAGRFSRYFLLTPDSTNTTDPANLQTMITNSYFHGFGYSTETKTVKASLAAIGLYVVIALAHFGFSVGTGRVGNSWPTTTDLLLLALNSPRPEGVLENTSVGAETREAFKELVNIRPNNEGSLELAFEAASSDMKKGGDVVRRRVQANKKY